jgi:aryl-alcohol dehydrogenase-like predicted oxidoreductase
MVHHLEQMAAKMGVTTAQLALAWVMAQGDDIVPIPGTKKRHRLIENIESLRVKLSPEQLGLLAAAAPLGQTFGARYADMSTVNH